MDNFPDTGAQPIYKGRGELILAVNGEIYNHIKLRDLGYKFKMHSDCEVIIPLVRTTIYLSTTSDCIFF